MSNGFSIADLLASEKSDFPLLIDELFTISNGFSVAEYIIFIKLIIFIYQNEF